MTAKANGVTIIVDPAQVNQIMRSPQGPVVRRLIEDGELVKREAKRLVGVYVPPPAGPRRARRPGTLRDSIVKRLVRKANGDVAVQVGSDDPIALWHHEGTRPHTIVPKKAPFLVFYSRRAGGVVYAKRVNHPGTQPNRYLVNALRVLRSRY